MALTRTNFPEGMKFGRAQRAEETVPGIGADAHDARERAFESPKTDGAQKCGEIGAEGKDRSTILVTGINREDKKNGGLCERRGNELRDGCCGCRYLGADRSWRHSNATCRRRK